MQLPFCGACKRHLPSTCFDKLSNHCLACCKRRETPHSRICALCLFVCRSIRVHVRTDTIFTKGENEMEQRVGAYFGSRVFDIDGVQQLDINYLISDFSQQVKNFNSGGSGYVLDRIKKFVILITKCRPLCGSTFIPTPQWLAKKRCVIIVKNADEYRFLWAILSALYPVKNYRDRVSNNRQHEGTLNVTGLTFPMSVKTCRHSRSSIRTLTLMCFSKVMKVVTSHST